MILIAKKDMTFDNKYIIYEGLSYKVHYINEFGGSEIGIDSIDTQKENSHKTGKYVIYFSVYQREKHFYSEQEIRKLKLLKINSK